MKNYLTLITVLFIFFPLNCILAETEKPNILIIFSDQQNTKTLGCYGAENMNTPNIDSLAKEGMRFKNFISNFPVCSPFRGMLMTGKYPFNSGVVHNGLTPKEEVAMMGTIFKKQGYLVGYTGKWHLWAGKHENISEKYRGGFSDYWDEMIPLRLRDSKGRRAIPKDRIDEHHGWYLDDYHADNAIGFIEKAASEKKPFLMVVSWNAPHPPYNALKEDLKKFPAERAKIPSTYGISHSMPDGKPYGERPPGDSPQDSLENRQSLVENVLRPYYASCESLDREFGRIMKVLNELKIADNTIVIYTSDHGDQIGAHNLIGKVKPFEESINVPFVVRYPKHIKKGVVTDALMSPMDVIPTILSLAGLKYDAKDFDGADISGVMESKKNPKEHDALLILSTPNNWRGVRTKTHTYVEISGTPWLLFDNIKDPDQKNNLIKSKSQEKLVESLKKRLYELLEESSDEPYLKYAKDSKRYKAALADAMRQGKRTD